MDVVYHRNCLDGIFSAYLIYLFAKSLTSKLYQQFVEHLNKKDQCALQTFIKQGQQQLLQYNEITEQFFHEPLPEISFSSVSMYAGEFYPVAPSKKNNILIIVDISPTDKLSIQKLSQSFSHIIIIEHHSSFCKTKQILSELQLPNIHYIWEEKICAAQLTLSFLNKSFNFPKNYPENLVEPLLRQIEYVGKNDLKINQNSISKQFVLGFYYFGVEMSHLNPFLFKRLWSMKVQTILDKGKSKYISSYVVHRFITRTLYQAQIRCEKGKFKGAKFFGIELKDRSIISDLGSILAYLSATRQNQNVAIIYNKYSEHYKISARSSLHANNPLALKIAINYGGGGHVCAAGCSIPKNVFKSHFKCEGRLNPKLLMSEKQIEKILFRVKIQ